MISRFDHYTCALLLTGLQWEAPLMNGNCFQTGGLAWKGNWFSPRLYISVPSRLQFSNYFSASLFMGAHSAAPPGPFLHEEETALGAPRCCYSICFPRVSGLLMADKHRISKRIKIYVYKLFSFFLPFTEFLEEMFKYEMHRLINLQFCFPCLQWRHFA